MPAIGAARAESARPRTLPLGTRPTHCEQGARALYHARSSGRLDDRLDPAAPAQGRL